MSTLFLRYRVRDFAAFKPVFDEFGAIRRAHGAGGHRPFRTVEDPSEVAVLIDFESADGARAFLADPARPGTLERAGADAASETAVLLDEVERIAYDDP
jgi:hypothetical protein